MTWVISNSCDDFIFQGEETIVKSDETVTIFGFPRNALMSIMQEFSSFGVILRYELDPNGGNWAHVQFENKFQVWSRILYSG